MGDLVLLSTTHRVAPGLLSWPAWQALARAASVHVAAAGHALATPLAAAGIGVQVAPAEPPQSRAARLLATARDADGTVVWCLADDGEPEFVRAVAELVTMDPSTAPAVELLPGSYDLPGARFLDLVAVLDRLRSPGGCPWDAEQTHASLVAHLLEEAYELVEAIETGDRAALREELGDVLMQVVFHARLAEEHGTDPFGVDDVTGDIVDKLVRRHPHVFGDEHVSSVDELHVRWDALKTEEKSRTSAVEGVPLAQPALALAGKLLGRTERAGLDLPVTDPVALPADDVDEARVGEVLMSAVAWARRHGVDPEQALRRAARTYADQVRAHERADGR